MSLSATASWRGCNSHSDGEKDFERSNLFVGRNGNTTPVRINNGL